MSQLRIVFAGVGAIGPAHPVQEPFEDQGPLQVVFPASSRRQTQGSENGGTAAFIPIHFVQMMTKLRPRNGMRPPDVVRESGWNIWHPVRERLELKFIGNPFPSKLVYQRDGNGNGGDLPEGDVRYLCDMREIFPERSTFRRNALSARIPAIAEVEGQVVVPYGVISSQFGGKDRRVVSFTPPRPQGLVRKTVAPELVVTVNGVTGVEIVSQSLDSGRWLDPIAFDLPTNAEIRFGNLDPLDVQRFITFDGDLQRAMEQHERNGNGDPHRGTNNRDVDFELYYSVLDGPDDKNGLPAPEFESGRGLESNCYVVVVGGGH
jgi:hypothetical protein